MIAKFFLHPVASFTLECQFKSCQMPGFELKTSQHTTELPKDKICALVHVAKTDNSYELYQTDWCWCQLL